LKALHHISISSAETRRGEAGVNLHRPTLVLVDGGLGVAAPVAKLKAKIESISSYAGSKRR
jgi:hypothetical protein